MRVGDLCFVALGQIVNRRFTAVRYQPSGGLQISSPVRSATLRQAVAEGLRGFTSQRHREALLRDFREPDTYRRREGAARRLSYYYPQALEEPALELLSRPSYDFVAVHRFARGVLYRTSDSEHRRELFDRFVEEHGPAGRAGLLVQLFEDLEMLEYDEEWHPRRRLAPFRTRPREILIELFDEPPDVRARSRPYVEHLSTTYLARTVELLVHDSSRRIDEAVAALMRETRYAEIALACMSRLVGRGYDADVRRTAERFLRRPTDLAGSFRQVLARIGSPRGETP